MSKGNLVVTDSFKNAMSSHNDGIATETIDAAWQRLQTSDAYWAGYSGVLVGGLVYSVILALVMTGVSLGMITVVTLVGVILGCTGLIGVIGAFVFWVFRGVNASLSWPLPSRYAAVAAAFFSGALLFFLPWLAVGGTFNKDVNTWSFILGLGADREIRKFEQRVAFNASGRVATKNEYRFGIGKMLLCTFWLAGMMAIFSWLGRLGIFPKGGTYFFIVLFITLFLGVGFSAILVGIAKVLRGMQKRMFYRKRPVSNSTIQA